VIKSIKDGETGKVLRRELSRRLPTDIQQVAYRKLRMLNNARSLVDLQVPPSNRLEKLKGDREGQHSIRINERWRICFLWRDNDAYQVEIVDYH
jgi:proteic killer suppression protein